MRPGVGELRYHIRIYFHELPTSGWWLRPRDVIAGREFVNFNLKNYLSLSKEKSDDLSWLMWSCSLFKFSIFATDAKVYIIYVDLSTYLSTILRTKRTLVLFWKKKKISRRASSAELNRGLRFCSCRIVGVIVGKGYPHIYSHTYIRTYSSNHSPFLLFWHVHTI